MGPKGTCTPRPSLSAVWPSESSARGAIGADLPDSFCQSIARPIQTVPRMAPPKTAKIAPRQPQKEPMAPRKVTSAKPIASLRRRASAVTAIQRIRPEPISKPSRLMRPERRWATKGRSALALCKTGKINERTTPKMPSQVVNASGMIMWSRSMNVAQIRPLRKTMPMTAFAGGKSIAQARKSAAVSNSMRA